MTIRHQLAEVLSDLTNKDGRPLAQIAKELGFSRQRLHQLRTGDKSAAPEAIEQAINQLGYEVIVGTRRSKDAQGV